MLGAVPGSGKVALVAIARPRKCEKKAQSDGNLLDSSAVLAHASRADLQTTIRQLERTGADESVVGGCAGRRGSCTNAHRGSEDRALHERSPVCPDVKTARRHRRALAAREEEQDLCEENEYDMETDNVGQWWRADKLGNS